LQQTIHRLRPDVIHSNGIKTHCLVSFANAAKIPVVWHVHDFFASRPVARRLLRMMSGRAAGAIAISRAVAEDLKTLPFAGPIEVLANVVNVDEFAPKAQDGALLDHLAGLPAADLSCLRVGLIATYARWKGHEVFLQAAACLRSRDHGAKPHSVRFYIIGGPIYRTQGSQYQKEELQQLAQKLGVSDCVGFINFQQEVAPIYRALDIVVQASTSPEPFGLTIIEAMACGKPVVASLAGGVVEIIRPGYDALGVPPCSVPALTDAIDLLLSDSALRVRLGEQARETVSKRFNQERIGEHLVNIYSNLCGCRQNEGSRQANFMIPSSLLLHEHT
jgi:glycosyltransferase involved in cell wall biosynthesis